MEIRPVGTDEFHERRQRETDMTKRIVAFRNFANALKNLTLPCYMHVRVFIYLRLHVLHISQRMTTGVQYRCTIYGTVTDLISQLWLRLHMLMSNRIGIWLHL